jgi:hypothetical protein
MAWLSGVRKTPKRSKGGRVQPAVESTLPEVLRLECITWEDHSSSHDWAELTVDGVEPTLVVTIGWVQYEDKNIVILVTNLRVDAPRCFGQIYIVKSAIHHRVPVKFDLVEKLLKRKGG